MQFQPVPEGLYFPCDQAGTILPFVYETEEDGEVIPKRALAYLPYGYNDNPEKRYPVLYLMHGGGGNEEEFWGGPEGKSPLKNLLDQCFAQGHAAPMIVVTPSYFLPGHETAHRDLTDARALTHRFPQELSRDLIPAVDSQFRTLPARWSRAFGGFSMGAETTWSVMAGCLQDVGVFLPMSGDFWALEIKGGKTRTTETADALIDALRASGIEPGDYRVLACTGDQDIAFEAMDPMVRELAKRGPWFELRERPRESSLCYCLKKNGVHTYNDCWEYVYNMLPWLFQ